MPGRLLALLVLALLSLAATPVRAHTLSIAYLDVVVAPDGRDLAIEMDVAIRDIALTFALDANGDGQVTWGELQAIREPMNDWLRSGLAISSGAGVCRLQTRGLATRRYDDATYAAFLLDARCPSRDGLQVNYGLLFDADPQHRALITLREGARVSTAIARADARSLRLGAESAHPFLDFLREGIHHILIGYDHLAFLISLLLPAVLIRGQRQWLAKSDLKTCFLHVLGIVTAFTAAHSITLSLAALGWVTPASRWVEAAIAASVLAAAMNNLFPVVVRRIWMVGFAFGLVHGFGFAGALAELGLPKGARLQALVGFNLGVEIGQLAVVTAVLPLLFAMRGRRWYVQAIVPLASLAIGALAIWWLYQRLRG